MFYLFAEKGKTRIPILGNSEKDLNKHIEKNWSYLFPHLVFIKSEFLLKGVVTGKDGSGKVDILAYNPNTKRFIVIELKRDENRYIRDQANYYRQYIEQNFDRIMLRVNEKYNVNLPLSDEINRDSVEIILIARKYSKADLQIIESDIYNITFIRYEWFAKSNENYLLFEYLNNTPEEEKAGRPAQQKEEKREKEFEYDTLIVPAHEDGFQEAFLGKNAWWAIRISTKNIDKIKYIAAYRAAPISAITHWATVEKIKKYKDTNKYIVHFKGKAKKIKPIKLISTKKGVAPRAPRYTTYKKLRVAKNFQDVFNEKTENTGKRNVVEDQILPVIELMMNEKSFAEACKTIAKKLDISVPSVRAKFYGKTYLYISASEVMECINNGRIKKKMLERFPDKKKIILQELGN